MKATRLAALRRVCDMIKTHSYLYLVGNFLVLYRAFSTLRNFPTFLALNCPEQLDILRNRLKFHIDIQISS